jgi:ribosomal protein S18 acetylase RimI-like enzyme
MSYYRSDWPEIGLLSPLNEPNEDSVLDTVSCNDRTWAFEKQMFGDLFRWTAIKNVFESNLYEFPIWDIHLTVNNPDGNLLNDRLDNQALIEAINGETQRLFSLPPWDEAYVTAKLVKGEPLHKALAQIGFEEIEHRRLYGCTIQDLKSETDLSSFDQSIQFTAFSAVPPALAATYKKNILNICRKAFASGYSRHFADLFLLDRRGGLDYIISVMNLNFQNLDPNYIFIAIDNDNCKVCGFSAVGKKSGLKGKRFTQLLSAVDNEYRGRGIYRGLTLLLSKTLPADAELLNVTHVANTKIQRAYRDSGRNHVADTVILRRIFKRTGDKDTA